MAKKKTKTKKRNALSDGELVKKYEAGKSGKFVTVVTKLINTPSPTATTKPKK